MSAAKPQVPSTNAGHAKATMSCIHDGHSTIGVMVMTAAATVAADDDSPAHIIAPANGSIAHGQDDRAKDGCVGADAWNNGSIERHYVSRRRLVFSAMTGGRS